MLLATLLASSPLGAVQPTHAAPLIATTTTLDLPTEPVEYGGPAIDVLATVSPAPASGGVWLYRVNDGARQILAANGVDPVSGVSVLRFSLSEVGVGAHELRAEFSDPHGDTYAASNSAVGTLNVVRYPVQLTLSASASSVYPGGSVSLIAKSPVHSSGLVTFKSIEPDDSEIDLGTGYLDWTGGDYRVSLTLASLSLGAHEVTAVIDTSDVAEGSTSNALTITVQKRPTRTTINASGEFQTNHPWSILVYPAAIGATSLDPIPTGSVTLMDGSTSLGTKSLVDGLASYDIPSFAVGSHNLTATYGGDDYHASSTSPTEAIEIGPDIVDAENVGVEYGTFYPVKDGYRDTVAIKGLRSEPISVSIKIYSPTGTSVKSASIARASGSYSYRWNGRNSAGAILASGKYKVVQTLTDAFGTKKSYTSYVKLSKKKLVTYTKNVTKAGSALSAKGKGGTGSVKVSTSAGYTKLNAGSNGWALAGWEFYIPSATVYKSVRFQVYAKASMSAPPTYIGMQNFSTCARTTSTWNDTCFGRWVSIGNASKSLAWFSTSSKSTSYRSGRYVRGLIDVTFSTVYVYKARAKVVYQVLE